MISFDVAKEEIAIVYKIARRAAKMAHDAGWRYDLVDAQMDITACHANGSPLKLQELLDADDSNFAHDVFGIRRHINRKTGELLNCFVPRYSA